MAVYKRNYKPYEGRLTPDWSRFLVPARYALETLFQSRLLIAFLVASCLMPIFAGAVIYLHHNLGGINAVADPAGTSAADRWRLLRRIFCRFRVDLPFCLRPMPVRA